MATDSSNPLAQYGYDQQTGKALADSLGISTAQLAAAFATTPMTGGSAPQTTSYGKTTGGQLPGRDLGQTVQQLQMMKAAGLGGSGAQASQTPSSNQVPVSQDPMNAMTNLGAAALNMPAIYNPTPSQIPQGKGGIGGVAVVPSPTSSESVPGVPQGPWSSTPGVLTSQGQAQANQMYAQYGGGQGTPQSVAKWYQGMTGQPIPGSNINNVPAPTAGGTPTPTTPFNAATQGQPAPFATAPAAPGASASDPWAMIGNHTSALEKAGQAMYAHFGGDPATATHQDIIDFHNKLQGSIGSLANALPTAIAGGAVPGSNYTAGIPPGISAAGPPPTGSPPPTKMQSGGLVPGRGNQDTVPALLTPGEYVIPKQQAAQMFGGRTPVRMQTGGFVPDDQEKKPLPAEARRGRLTPPGSPPPAPGQDASSGQPTQQGSAAPEAPSSTPSYGAGTNWAQVAQQARAAQAANANVGSGGPGSIDSLGTLGDESIITGQGGPGQPGGPGSATMAASGAISDLASGLAKAAQTYAASIKPWQMQKQAFGQGGTPNYQNVNFQQDATV
jgi:hypothetical protein